MNLENEDLDEYVPLMVMNQFASDFVKVPHPVRISSVHDQRDLMI